MPRRSALPYYAIAASLLVLFILLRPYSYSRPSENMQHGEAGQSMMIMPMWFQWTIDTILWFRSLHPTSLVPYLGSVGLLAALALAHEALASYRVSMTKAYSTAAIAQGYIPVANSQRKEHSPLKLRAVNSLLYTANLTTGYLLMLAVMTFNVGESLQG
eukprot:GHRR01037473.1.p1 GENE.GHRR01037473.1~~GHRR01037473.1.p1  ORF type:complete len:159 (-),score=18.22 GHRR01037473.1:510-986(-)